MEQQELVQAWNFVKQAAENSVGTLIYHQTLQDAINKVAKWMQAKLEDKAEEK